MAACSGSCARCRGRCTHSKHERRSGSPLAGPAAVKTCAREPGGFPARASPGRCSKTARRRRTSMDASGIRVCPGSSLKLAFLRGRNPTRDLPPCQRAAPWCAVTSRATRLASREPGSRRFASVPRVLRVLRVRTARTRADVGRADAASARSMARAAFSRRASMRPPASTPDSNSLPGAAFSPTRWLRSNGGDCQLPLEPRRARNNALHTGVFPGMRVSGVMLIGWLQVSNPREGVEITRSSGTSGSSAGRALAVQRWCWGRSAASSGHCSRARSRPSHTAARPCRSIAAWRQR